MKTYTTPTVSMQLEGAEEVLASAERVILTARNGLYSVDKDWPEGGLDVDGDTVSAKLTQGETARLGAAVDKNGKAAIAFEVTVKFPDGTVVKSETAYATIADAVRKEEV